MSPWCCCCWTAASEQWRSQPKNMGGGKMFDFRRIALFCLKKRSQSTKWLYVLKFGEHGPLPPLVTPMQVCVLSPLLHIVHVNWMDQWFSNGLHVPLRARKSAPRGTRILSVIVMKFYFKSTIITGRFLIIVLIITVKGHLIDKVLPKRHITEKRLRTTGLTRLITYRRCYRSIANHVRFLFLKFSRSFSESVAKLSFARQWSAPVLAVWSTPCWL